jgi:tetratricopeptide (TPR) repeat protein
MGFLNKISSSKEKNNVTKKSKLKKEHLKQDTDKEIEEKLNHFVSVGDFESAKKLCEKILRERPNSPDALSSYGSILTMEAKTTKHILLDMVNLLKEADSFFDKAIKLDPNFEGAHFGKGATLHLLGMCVNSLTKNTPELNIMGVKFSISKQLLKELGTEDATTILMNCIKHSDMVLEADPKKIDAWVYKADSLYMLNKRKEAEKCKKEALKLNPKLLENEGYLSLLDWDRREKGEKEQQTVESEGYSEKIKNFDKFSLDIDGEWITLEDEEGHFFGQYHQSNNKKYIVAYCDAHGESDKKGCEITVPGQVYLINDQKRIMWQKNIDRPNRAFVTDEGIVVVVDWISFGGKLAGKIHFFDGKGEKTFEHKFGSNIGGQSISNDGDELIITTCFPENAIYLFDIKQKKLIKKVNNETAHRPLIKFNFNDAKKLILSGRPYVKQEIPEIDYSKLSPFDQLMHQGYLCRDNGKFEKGIEFFKKAMDIKTTGSLLKGMGYCYMGLGKFDEAIKYFQKAMETSPQQRKMLPKYIELCKRRKKSFDECTQDEIDDIYLKVEGRDLKKERAEHFKF